MANPNTTIIQQNVNNWFEAFQKLSEYSQKLKPEEQTIVEWLKDYWRNYPDMDDDDGQCQSYLEELKTYYKKHPDCQQIIDQYKVFVGVAKQMFLKDNDTYHEFQRMAREYVRTHKPKPQPVTPPVTPATSPVKPVTPKPADPTKPVTPTAKPSMPRPGGGLTQGGGGTTDTTPPPSQPAKNNSSGCGGCLFLLAFIAAVWWAFFDGGYKRVASFFRIGDGSENVTQMYALEEEVYLREGGPATSKPFGYADYGEVVRMDEEDPEQGWAHVQYSTMSGYVDRASIGTAEELEDLESIWGGFGTRSEVTDILHRRALIAFLKMTKENGNYERDGGYKLYVTGNNSGNIWRSFSVGDYGVFAFIVDYNGGRKAVLYIYDERGKPCHYKACEVAPNQYIKKVTYRNGIYDISLGTRSKKQAKKRSDTPVVQPSDSPMKPIEEKIGDAASDATGDAAAETETNKINSLQSP